MIRVTIEMVGPEDKPLYPPRNYTVRTPGYGPAPTLFDRLVFAVDREVFGKPKERE